MILIKNLIGLSEWELRDKFNEAKQYYKKMGYYTDTISKQYLGDKYAELIVSKEITSTKEHYKECSEYINRRKSGERFHEEWVISILKELEDEVIKTYGRVLQPYEHYLYGQVFGWDNTKDITIISDWDVYNYNILSNIIYIMNKRSKGLENTLIVSMNKKEGKVMVRSVSNRIRVLDKEGQYKYTQQNIKDRGNKIFVESKSIKEMSLQGTEHNNIILTDGTIQKVEEFKLLRKQLYMNNNQNIIEVYYHRPEKCKQDVVQSIVDEYEYKKGHPKFIHYIQTVEELVTMTDIFKVSPILLTIPDSEFRSIIKMCEQQNNINSNKPDKLIYLGGYLT